VPLKVVKACLPDPSTLAPNYTGKTCIGNLVKGKKDGKEKEIFIYNVCDHQECYNEVESQAISYTAGVPAAAAAMLVANGTWNPRTMVNVEELDPDPFLALLDTMGLPTDLKFIKPPKSPAVRAVKTISAKPKLKPAKPPKTKKAKKEEETVTGVSS